MPWINGRFYMNPAHGRAVELARAAETAAQHPMPHEQQHDGTHWVTIDHHHVLIDEVHVGEHHKHTNSESLPPSGQASIYADSFEGRKTANGATFRQDEYTAALLPRERWHAVPLGTRVELPHDGRRVVVEINERGAGDRKAQSTRTLDLSRAAASALTGQPIKNDRDAKSVGLIRVDNIREVPANTPLGPVH